MQPSSISPIKILRRHIGLVLKRSNEEIVTEQNDEALQADFPDCKYADITMNTQ